MKTQNVSVTVQLSSAQLKRLTAASKFIGQGCTPEKLLVAATLGSLEWDGGWPWEAKGALRLELQTYAHGNAYAHPEKGVDLADGVLHTANDKSDPKHSTYTPEVLRQYEREDRQRFADMEKQARQLSPRIDPEPTWRRISAPLSARKIRSAIQTHFKQAAARRVSLFGSGVRQRDGISMFDMLNRVGKWKPYVSDGRDLYRVLA
jgi:hypothetical protein